MTRAVAEAAAAKGMCASDSLRMRAGEIEAALAASEAELDRQEAASRAATQVRDEMRFSQPSLYPNSASRLHVLI